MRAIGLVVIDLDVVGLVYDEVVGSEVAVCDRVIVIAVRTRLVNVLWRKGRCEREKGRGQQHGCGLASQAIHRLHY
jgi:hypothetical protein